MKRFDKNAFLELLGLWDKKHHLLGRVSPSLLYDQSVEALRGLDSALLGLGAIDLGAGNGILGIPALLEGLSTKVCLIEPLPKRVAFLEACRAEMRILGDESWKNLAVIPLPVQSVSRETLVGYFGEGFAQVGVLSRAFSGTLSMQDALRASVLNENPCYKFFVSNEAKSPKYVLVKEEPEGV